LEEEEAKLGKPKQQIFRPALVRYFFQQLPVTVQAAR
jgi:hypothetical protein